ncbi:MAG: SH3 domain-containing protein [Alphaproteobacteria bacterium]|nr:SH3 domain-containing protein [Alphaproteobacteria bacterium]
MSNLSHQTPEQQGPEVAQGGNDEESAPVGSLAWAQNLVSQAGNAHLASMLGGLTGGWVGAAIGNWIDSSLLTPSGPEAPAETEQPPQLRVRVTASQLNVRATPDSTSGARVGRLSQGDEVAVVGEQGEWLLIEFEGQTAWIHGGYTTPVEATTGGPNTTQATNTPEEPATATEEPANNTTAPANNTEPAATTDAGTGEVEIGSDAAERRVLQLATDFNNIPVWNKESGSDQQPNGSFRTPYVLNTVDQCAEASQIKRLTIAQGRPHAGQTVSQAAGGRPFIGKATPDQMQIVAQACIDNDLATPGNIQTYVNQGRQRTASRRNGKFGVDCSGFTSQMMQDLEGDGRDGFTSTNAASFKHDGSRNYTPINPDDAAAGDVISYETTNHVLVITNSTDVQMQAVGATGDGGATRRAVKLSVAESTGSQADSGEYIRTDRRFFYFPNAGTVMGEANTQGPEWKLAAHFSDDLPRYQAAMSNVSYAGGNNWTSDYTLNCAGDANGTNIRVRESGGNFTMTSATIPNGASNVELKEVSGDMVRVRYNGEDTRDGKEMWVPVRYVASSSEGYNIPTQGQPGGLRVSRYSVVRNPNLGVAQQNNGDAVAEAQ